MGDWHPPIGAEAARFAARLAAVLACVALGILATSFAIRVPFPYALEWQESAMLEHAMRARSGAPIYVEPSPEFAPFPYPPLFHWLGAAAISACGASLPALRLVSVASTVLLLGCVFIVAARRGGTVAGVIGAGFLAATYTWAGEWLDVARVDTLALALSAAAIAVATSRASLDGRAAPAGAAGALAALAVLAKQTSLGLAIALAAGLALRRASRRSALGFSVGLFVVLVPVVLWLQGRSDGWFRFTTVDVLAGSPWYRPAVVGFWLDCAVAFAPLIALWIAGRGPVKGQCRVHPAYACALIALVLTAWIGRAHEGGFRNTLLPAALAAAFVAGPVTVRACELRPRVSMALVLAAFAWLLLATPRGPLPEERDRSRAEAIVQRIESIEGDIWQPHGAVDPAVPGGVHGMAIIDLLKSGEDRVARSFVESLTRALDQKRFAAIVFGVEPEVWSDLPALARNYAVLERLDAADPSAAESQVLRQAFVTPTGAPHTPRVLLIPR